MTDTEKSCWRRIGVYAGDHSCERLAEVSHCRNCLVYQDAARTLYQRENELAESAIDLWQVSKTVEHSALVVSFGQQHYGIDSKILAEVVDDRVVRRVAHRTSDLLLGMIAIRGELRLLVNLPALLGLPASSNGDTNPHSQARMVLLRDSAERHIAIRAEAVLGMYQFDLAKATEPPSLLAGELKKYALGVVELAPLSDAVQRSRTTNVPLQSPKRVLLLKGPELIRVLETAWYQ